MELPQPEVFISADLVTMASLIHKVRIDSNALFYLSLVGYLMARQLPLMLQY